MTVIRRLLIWDLNPLHLPLPAMISILHRVSGVFLILMIPLLLWGLNESLKSDQHFELLMANLSQTWVKLLLGFLLLSLGFHVLAGLRHILMDLHIGESKHGGRIGAIIVLVLFSFLVFILGGVLWN